jgi:uncharacterized protein YjbI with pentapeptide repeats
MENNQENELLKIKDEVKSITVENNRLKRKLKCKIRVNFFYKSIKKYFTIQNIGIIIPICLTVLQTWYIYTQNRRIDQQTYLQEADRRASMAASIDEVLNKVDEELKDAKNKKRELSPLLISRIIALSQSLKPYKYLEGDNLSEKLISIERGQLLKSLIVCELGINTLDKIFDTANFSYADLSNSNLKGAHLRHANLEYADFSNSQMTGVNLIGANLKNTKFYSVSSCCQTFPKGVMDCEYSGIDFSFAKLDNSIIQNSDFSGSEFFNTEINNVKIINTEFNSCRFNSCEFIKSNLRRVSFSDTDFIDVPFYSLDSLGRITSYVSFKDTINLENTRTSDKKMLNNLKKYIFISDSIEIETNPVIELNDFSDTIKYYKIYNKYSKTNY